MQQGSCRSTGLKGWQGDRRALSLPQTLTSPMLSALRNPSCPTGRALFAQRIWGAHAETSLHWTQSMQQTLSELVPNCEVLSGWPCALNDQELHNSFQGSQILSGFLCSTRYESESCGGSRIFRDERLAAATGKVIGGSASRDFVRATPFCICLTFCDLFRLDSCGTSGFALTALH